MQFQIQPNSPLPIYQQLVNQVREAAARGELEPGERLPSVRQLSRELTVNPNTVARAYTELERGGLVSTRPGLGVFVTAARPELTAAAKRRRLAELLDGFLTEAVHLGLTADETLQLVNKRVTQFQWTMKAKARQQAEP